MVRSLTANFITAVTADVVFPRWLLKMEFDSGNVNFWNGHGNFTYNGDTYTGLGDLVGMGNLKEPGKLDTPDLVCFLSSVPTTNRNLAFQEEYQGRTATLYLALLDTNWTLPSNDYVYPYFTGFIDAMSIKDDDKTNESTISVTLRSYFAVFDVANLRRYTPWDWNATTSTMEHFLNFVARLQDRETVFRET